MITNYLKAAVEENVVPNLKDFVEKERKYIVANSVAGEDILQLWATSFGTVANSLKIATISCKRSVPEADN